jgi:dihydropyrimidinase
MNDRLDGAGHRPTDSVAGGLGDPARVPGKMDLVVRGGTIVNADGRRQADIGVAGGRVAQIGGTMAGTREIDASGRLVLPGGVDPHVHLNVEQVDPREPDWVDDYTSGSEAALAGGVTTVGNMSYVLPWETIADRVRAETALVAKQAIADVFFHAVVLTPSAEIVAEVGPAVEAGQSSMKFFMCLPSFDASAPEFTRVMQASGEAGGLTLIHCEDLATIECCTAVLSSRAHLATAHFAESRPVSSEVIAVARAIAMCRATGAPTYIVHLSSAAALDACAAARAEGLPLFVETRPLYLYLTEERYRDADGGIYVAQPPLRADADREALWRGIADGTIDTLASDHAPWTRALKLDPKLDVAHPRPGVAELDTMLPLFFTEAVAKERITLERFVALTATNAARLCGIYPRKGTIAVGSDADLVLWETRRRRIIRDEDLFSRAGHTVYAGREISAWPAMTIRRGEVVFEDGRIVGRPGSGQVVPRGKSQPPR